MKYIPRLLEDKIRHSLSRNKSVLLFGARQTGKTTLTSRFDCDLSISFIQPDIRQRYEKSPQLLKNEIDAISLEKKRPLVILEEVKKVHDILDVVQDLIDRQQANFILTGSSARKLRRGAQVNLLPGRVTTFKIDPFNLEEFPAKDLNERLLYGSLPGILATAENSDREIDLNSYVTTYL